MEPRHKDRSTFDNPADNGCRLAVAHHSLGHLEPELGSVLSRASSHDRIWPTKLLHSPVYMIGFNLVNMICTYTELTILLEQNQTGAAFSVLSRMIT